MANWFEPTQEQRQAYAEWAAERPTCVRSVASRLEPWALYRLTSTNQIVTVYSISEPEAGEPATVTVNVVGHAVSALLLPGHGVFGVDPNDLEPYEPSTRQELMALASRAAA